jgi:hypothetical protein
LQLKTCSIALVRVFVFNNKVREKVLPAIVLNCMKNNYKAFLGIPISQHVSDLTAKKDNISIK